MIAIGFLALGGDPNLLTYGFDSRGYLCGTSNKLWGDENGTVSAAPNFAKRTSLMYYDVTEYSTMTVIPAKAVCMTKCPNATIEPAYRQRPSCVTTPGPQGTPRRPSMSSRRSTTTV